MKKIAETEICFGTVSEIGVIKSQIGSETESIRDDISEISAGLKRLERVQKKQCWQNAFRCGKRRKEQG